MKKTRDQLSLQMRIGKKWIRVMKITTLLLMIGFLQIHATVVSQGNQVSITESDISLEELLWKLQKETDFVFVFSQEHVKKHSSLNISLQGELDEVLTEVLSDKGLTYEKKHDVYVIKKAPPKPNVPQQPETITITGKVTDEQGQPLPFVNLYIKGENRGVITDQEGNYTIEVEERSGMILVASFIGFATKEFEVAGRTEINLILKADIADLSEVKVYGTGLTTISKERATGSFSVVSVRDIETSPDEEIVSSLEGNITGLQENKQTGDLTIRGRGTINSEEAPLVVVDGFPIEGGFETINPNDIDNVTVLKDAAAASIWGARAGNGVIVVTTKKGNRSGKINVQVNSYLKMGEVFDFDYNLARASVDTQLEYEKYIIDNNYGSNQTPDDLVEARLVFSKGMQAYWDYQRGEITERDLNSRIEQLRGTNYKDDVKKYLLRRPVTHQHNVSISGSSDKSSYNLSVLYNNVKGHFKESGDDKVLINFRNNYQFKEWLGMNFGLTTGFTKKDNSGASLADIRNMSPYEKLMNSDGTYAQVDYGINYPLINPIARSADGIPYTNWGYNPLQESLNRDLITKGVNARIQAAFDVKILEGLHFKPSFQYESVSNKRENHYGEETYYVRDIVNENVDYDRANNTVGNQYVPMGGILNKTNSENKTYNLRNQLNFDRKIGEDHELNLLAAVEHSWSEFESDASSLYGYDSKTNVHVDPPYGYGSTEFSWSSLISGRPGKRISSGHTLGESKTRLFSVFANAAYTYKKKYTITGSYRTDASNMIVDDPKFRYSPFWSIGGSWNMIHESFMKDVDFVDRLILRSTFGVSGNTIQSASTVPVIGVSQFPSSRSGEIYAYVSDLGNPTLRWEKINQFNLALDFSLFKRKLYGTVEVYDKQSEDLLANVSIAPTYGSSTQQFNAAKVSNKGAEISLNSDLKFGDLKWNTGINYSYNTNEVTSLNISHIHPSSITYNQFVEGEPMFPTYSYVYGGMNEDNVPTIIGENGTTYTMNESIGSGGETGQEVLKNMGTLVAPTVIGWNNTLQYKGFTFRAMLTAKFGHVYRRSTIDYNLDNRLKKYYHEDLNKLMDGQANEMGLPVLPDGFASNTGRWSSYVPYLNSLVDNADHVRLKELYLGYDMPKGLISRVGLTNLTLYAHARNLGTIWTANDNGIDPDYVRGYGLKPGASYTFGVKLGF